MTNANPIDRGSPESLGQTISKGLSGRCPRCGKAPLFAGFLDNAGSCTNCGLDYTFIDSGDGPAVFGETLKALKALYILFFLIKLKTLEAI